ncbi:MAG: single-stranded DNA-binding protein, partial [Chloroflexota bacterium]|nr:single-stranded DNA-binding protein [Chloroflexota bacterium]
LNKIMIIGNLGGDPEMRYTPNGTPVTSFSVAVNRSYTRQDGERAEETEWFRVSAWRQLAEQANQYLAKGRLAYVEGRLRSRTFQGNDGQTRFVNEIDANQIVFLDRSGDRQYEDGFGGSREYEPAGAGAAADDLPF